MYLMPFSPHSVGDQGVKQFMPCLWVKGSKLSEGAGVFPACLNMNWNDNRLNLNYNRIDNANQNYGAASSFRPLFLSSK